MSERVSPSALGNIESEFRAVALWERQPVARLTAFGLLG
jgi:hypothetical protein